MTAGTLFDKTRTPLTVWFEAAWLMVSDKSGVSAAHLHRVLTISSYQTAWTMLGKFRTVMSAANSQPLAGRVEVDETFIGGPPPRYRRARSAGQDTGGRSYRDHRRRVGPSPPGCDR